MKTKTYHLQNCCKDCKFVYSLYLNKGGEDKDVYFCNFDKTLPDDINYQEHPKWENRIL